MYRFREEISREKTLLWLMWINRVLITNLFKLWIYFNNFNQFNFDNRCMNIMLYFPYFVSEWQAVLKCLIFFSPQKPSFFFFVKDGHWAKTKNDIDSFSLMRTKWGWLKYLSRFALEKLNCVQYGKLSENTLRRMKLKRTKTYSEHFNNLSRISTVHNYKFINKFQIVGKWNIFYIKVN